MDYILFDDEKIRISLLPLTYYRPVAKIRIGILTIEEKWSYYFKKHFFFKTQKYLSEKFKTSGYINDSLFINGAVCPTPLLHKAIIDLNDGECLKKDDVIIAYRNKAVYEISFAEEVTVVKNLWDIFVYNGSEIVKDFQIVSAGRNSLEIKDPYTIVYSGYNIFMEEGAEVKAAILNAENGPIYLGKNSQVLEGAIIKGPFALGEESIVNIGAKIKGDTTIGPYCKVGGEISNSVIFGYSNKGHEGFLGNSVIGEWCNIGADTNTSNLKNNYAFVDIYNYSIKRFSSTQRQFCGLIMGDHSKAGINTMFNTGTVVGFNCNVFGAGFPPKFIPSFSWGGSSGFTTFDLDKSYEVAERVMARRNLIFDQKEKNIFKAIFEGKDILEN